MKLHKSVTIEKVVDAVERNLFTLDNPGFCIACGAEVDSCDPDAHGDDCDECGQPQVFGADELLMCLAH